MEDIVDKHNKEILEGLKKDLDRINKDYIKFLKYIGERDNEENRMDFAEFLNETVIHDSYTNLLELKEENIIGEIEDAEDLESTEEVDAEALEDLRTNLNVTLFFRIAIMNLTELLLFKRDLYDSLVEKYKFIPDLIDTYIKENYALVDSLLNISSSLYENDFDEDEVEDFDEDEIEEE